MRPLKNLPRALTMVRSTLTTKVRKIYTPYDGVGFALHALPIFICSTPARQKSGHFCGAQDLKYGAWYLWRCARERYIGEGVFGARERDINASPMTISLVTFLFRRQESNILQLIDKMKFEEQERYRAEIAGNECCRTVHALSPCTARLKFDPLRNDLCYFPAFHFYTIFSRRC